MPINSGAQAGNATYVAAAAIEQGSTWNTAVAVGAGDGIAITGESITGGRAALPREDIGFPFGQQPDVGAEMHRGSVEFDLMHGGGHGKLMSLFFGTQTAATQTGGGSAGSYLHICALQTALTKFATLCISKRASAKWWQYASVMARKLTLSGQGNERVKGSIEFLCSTLDRDSSTNTTTETDAVTVPTRRGLSYAKQGLFRLNAQAGGALSSTTDDVPILGFTLTAERKLSEDMLIDGTGTIAQPAEEDETEIMLDVTFRSYDAETWIAAYLAKTEYKADLKFLSGYTPSGSGSVELYILLNFARMVVAEQPQAPVSGRGRIPHTVRFKVLTPSAAPTGMSGLTQPFELRVMDEVSSAYLS